MVAMYRQRLSLDAAGPGCLAAVGLDARSLFPAVLPLAAAAASGPGHRLGTGGAPVTIGGGRRGGGSGGCGDGDGVDGENNDDDDEPGGP